jgi:Tol biopolymer transport system component
MGEVYRGKDTKLKREVALKVLPDAFARDPERMARFQREAEVLASLNHPNIAVIHGVEDNALVMELVEGETLPCPLPIETAFGYARQISEALEYAHERGVIHRDLKPANIKVTPEGVIKLLDFGLAKAAEDPGGATDDPVNSPTLTMGHTRAGVILGTAAYMSPEQAVGKKADRRSDIFSFGVVLYEMLAGKRAFAGESMGEMLASVVKDEPDWAKLPTETPAAIRTLLRRCLTKDRKQRLQAIGEARIVLENPGETEVPLRAKARFTWWPWAVTAATVAGALLFAALWRGRAPATGGDLLSFAVYPPAKAVFSAALNTTVSVPQFAIAPDGRSIVFTAESPGARPMLWVRPMEQVEARMLPGTEDALHPFWSPDGRWIGFSAEGKLKKIPAAGGAVQIVAQSAVDFRGGTWGLDDTIVFATGSEPLQRISSAGGPVTMASTLESQVSYRHPQFLPDGRHFLYLGLGSEQGGVYVGSLDDKSKKLMVKSNASAVYSPPGYLLFVDGDTLLGQVFDPQRLEVSGQPFLVAEHVGHSSAFQSAIAASPAGIIAYASAIAQNGRLTWFDRGGNGLGSAGPEGDYTDFRLSPGENSLAASLVDPKTGTVDVWMTDLARGSSTRVTREGMLGASAIWSPDGAHLMFRAIRNGLVEFHQKSAGGGGNEQAVLANDTRRAAQIQSVNLIDTDWSPDGQNILFSVPGVAAGNDLWLMPLGGDRKPVKFLATPAEEMHGNFSPDGHLVAYTSNESGKFEIYVQTFPLSDKKWKVSTEGGYEPRWRTDGREIYYLSEDRKLMTVSVGAGPSFDVPKLLFQTRVPPGVTANRTHYVPSRGGERFLVNTEGGDPSPTPITVVLNWTAALKK